jgi:ubiquitin C
LDVEASDTIKMVKAMIQVKEGIPRGEQRLIFKDVELEGGSLMEAGVEDGATLVMLMHLTGGAKVIKHVVKTAAVTRVTFGDRAHFSSVHQTAMSIMDAPGLNINNEITSMSVAQLEALGEYLTNKVGKTTNTVKAKNMYTLFPAYEQLTDVIAKCTVAMKRLQDMYLNDLEARYYSESGSLEFDRLVLLVVPETTFTELIFLYFINVSNH